MDSQRWKRYESSYPELPVVMLSTYDNPTYIARAAALGATDYIIKTTAHVSISAILRSLASGQPPIRAAN